MKDLFSYGRQGELLDKPSGIKSINIWQTKCKLIDQINQTMIALIHASMWGNRHMVVAA